MSTTKGQRYTISLRAAFGSFDTFEAYTLVYKARWAECNPVKMWDINPAMRVYLPPDRVLNSPAAQAIAARVRWGSLDTMYGSPDIMGNLRGEEAA